MRAYDSSRPLFFLHLPKTAGTSLKEVFRDWFGDGLQTAYSRWALGGLPRFELRKRPDSERPICVYGHFNRQRGRAIERYDPDASQFLTLYRDPLERAVSLHAYLRRCSRRRPWRTGYWRRKSLRTFLEEAEPGFVNHLPLGVHEGNFVEFFEENFVEVGVLERLDESVQRFANALGKHYRPGSIPHLNAADTKDEIPEDVRERFLEKYAFEVKVHRWALSRFESAEAELEQGRPTASRAPT